MSNQILEQQRGLSHFPLLGHYSSLYNPWEQLSIQYILSQQYLKIQEVNSEVDSLDYTLQSLQVLTRLLKN